MEIDVARLAAEGIALAFARPLGELRITVGPSRGVGGRVSTGREGTRVDAATTEVLRLEDLYLPLSEGALEVQASLELSDVRVELTFPPGEPWSGSIAAGTAACERVRVRHPRLGELPLEITELAIAGIDVRVDAGAVHLRLARIAAGAVEARIRGELWRVDGLVVEGLEVSPAGLRAQEARIVRGELVIGEARVALGEVAIDGAARDPSGELRVDAVTAGEASVWIGAIAAKPATKTASPSRAPIDLRLLDGARGHLRAEVLTDVRIPILGSRRASHTVRLDVRDGAIEYKRLEKGLAHLEDALLDFAVRGGELILEKDIPLVPFDNQTLVSWALDAEAQRLAASGWVRLSTLARPRLAGGGGGGEGALREILADGIDVLLELPGSGELELPGGVELSLGDGTQGACRELSMRGRVRYRPGEATEPTALELTVADLTAGARWGTGPDARHLGGLRVAKLAARAELRGVRPSRLDVTIAGLAAGDIRLPA